MHYFPSWTEEAVLNMSYEKFIMYLATIPDTSPDDESDTSTEKETVKTGSFNLFDFDQR